MSGDSGLSVAVTASLESLHIHSDLHLYLVGDRSKVESEIQAQICEFYPSLRDSFISRISVVHADDVVSMEDKPTLALRQKTTSSMAKALHLVKTGEAAGCVTAGNTGALMVLSRSILGMLPGIDRPAITKRIPTPMGATFILDLGANVDCHAEHLYQFGVMGSLLCESLGHCTRPRIALLNVGVENNKGNEQVRLASQMLQANAALNFVGYVEGHDIFTGYTDVIVCDGFVGNVALKTSEGLANLFITLFKRSFQKNIYMKFLGFMVSPVLKRIFKRIDPSNHNGAILLGVQGVVVKSHGAASAAAFSEAIQLAVKETQYRVAENINKRLDELLI
jgi:glycerol-3-phosphate acyltransferase PlsX